MKERIVCGGQIPKNLQKKIVFPRGTWYHIYDCNTGGFRYEKRFEIAAWHHPLSGDACNYRSACVRGARHREKAHLYRHHADQRFAEMVGRFRRVEV